MWQWLRELREILSEPAVCPSCEVLKTEIANMRHERDLLLHKVLASPSEQVLSTAPEPVTIPTTKHKPWRVMQQELEKQDSIKAAQLRKEFEERTANLERNLGVADASKAL